MLEIRGVIVAVIMWVLAYKRPWLGLLFSPFGCFCILVIGVVEESEPMFVLGPGVIIGTAIVILVAPRDPLADPRPKRWAKLTLWGVFVLAIALALSTVMGLLVVPAFLIFLLYVISVVASGFEARRSTASLVLTTLGASMRQNLPLPMALDSAAAGRDDMAGYVMRQISRWLIQGYSLSEAIKRGYPRCPGHAYGMIVAAERIGQLPTAFKVIEQDMHARAERRNMVNPIYPFYPLALIVVISLVVSGLMTFVMPQFHSIIQEMKGMSLPPATKLLLNVYRYVGDWIGWVVMVAVILAGIPTILQWCRPRRPDRRGFLSQMADLIRWHLPILHWFERNRSIVQTVDGLRMALAAGCTVDQAIANTLHLDTNLCFRRRLKGWLTAVQQGQDVAVAAIRSRLAPALAWAFDTRVNQGNTPAVLEMIDSFYRSNYSYRVNLARLFLWPSVTVMMACLVGFVAYAIFSPMVAMIYACIDYIP